MNDKLLKIGVLAVAVAVAGGIYYLASTRDVRVGAYLEVRRDLTLDEIAQLERDVVAAERNLENAEQNYKEGRYKGLTEKGAALYSMGKIGEAEVYMSQAKEIFPKNFTAYLGLFRIKADMNDTEAAKENAEKALELRPKSAETWVLYADYQKAKLGATQEQLRAIYEDAVSKTQSDALVLKKYARYLEEVGDYTGALDKWKKALEVEKTDKPGVESEIKRVEGIIAQQ